MVLFGNTIAANEQLGENLSIIGGFFVVLATFAGQAIPEHVV